MKKQNNFVKINGVDIEPATTKSHWEVYKLDKMPFASDYFNKIKEIMLKENLTQTNVEVEGVKFIVKRSSLKVS